MTVRATIAAYEKMGIEKQRGVCLDARIDRHAELQWEAQALALHIVVGRSPICLVQRYADIAVINRSLNTKEQCRQFQCL
jgi:hypothetical protein